MRRALAVIVFAAAISGVCEASEATKAIVGSYLQIHAALAADKVDGIKPAAQAIATEASKMGAAGTEIVKTANAIEAAADVKAARAAFGPLSDAVIRAAADDGWKDLPDAKVGYCGMVKQSWIQTDDKIRNPYYGSSMLTCGEFKKK